MEKFLILLILGCSVFLKMGSGYQITLYKEIASLSAISLFLAWWVWKHNKWLALFLLWGLIRVFLPPDQPRATFMLTNMLAMTGIYLGIQYLSIDKKRLFEGICIACGIQIAAVYLQAINLFPFWNADTIGSYGSYGRIWGLFGNSNFSAAFIAITLPAFLYMAKINKWYLLGLSGIPALFLLNAQFGIVAGLAGIALYGYFTYRKYFKKLLYPILILLIIATVWVTLYPIYLADYRWETWYRIWEFLTFTGLKDWHCHFLQGWGLGNAYEILPKITVPISDIRWGHTHNWVLDVLFEFGLIGLILISGLIMNTLRKFNINKLVFYAILLSFFIDALGFHLYRTAPMGYMGIIALGLIDKE